MIKVLLFLSSALVSIAMACWLGPVVLLVCPALALAAVVLSMLDSQTMRGTSTGRFDALQTPWLASRQ